VVGHDTITYLEKASPEVLQSMGITVGNLDSTTKKYFRFARYCNLRLVQKIPNQKQIGQKIEDILKDDKIKLGIEQL
jgi:hypothetical protein